MAEENEILLRKRKQKELKAETEIYEEETIKVDDVHSVATLYIPPWIPNELLDEIAKKYGLKHFRIRNTSLSGIQDIRTVRILNVDALKDFEIRYRLFLEELYRSLTNKDLLFDYTVNQATLNEFAKKMVVEINKTLGISEADIESLKKELLIILNGIIYEEEAEYLARAICSTQAETSAQNMTEFLRIFLRKTQSYLFGIVMRAFQTLYFFNFISENLGKDYLGYDSVVIKAFEKSRELKDIKLPDPFGGGSYHKAEKIGMDEDMRAYYVINVDVDRFALLIYIFAYFLGDNARIEEACWYLEQLETILRRFKSWENEKLFSLLNALKSKASAEDVERLKEAFIYIHQFLLKPANNIIRESEEVIMTVIKNSFKAKQLFKNYWLGNPPSWFIDMLPENNLDRLRKLKDFTKDNRDSLEKFISEFTEKLDILIEEKKTKKGKKIWDNIKELSEMLGRFFKGLGGLKDV